MQEHLGGDPTPNIDGFSDIEHHDSGGVGVIYRARQRSLSRYVALKSVTSNRVGATDALRAEASLQASLTNVAQIVTIHDLVESDDGRSFIVMDWCDGGSALDLLQRGTVGVEQFLTIAMDASHGLAEAHAARIVHGDIKPANILFDERQQARLSDFGVATAIGANTSGQLPPSGTIEFAAPECIEGGPSNYAADVYSLGLTLAAIWCGEHPIAPTPLPTNALASRLIHYQLPDLTVRGLPDGLAALLAAATDKDPEKRPSAQRMYSSFVSEGIRLGHVSGPQGASLRSDTFRRMMFVIPILALSLLIALLVWPRSNEPKATADYEVVCAALASFDQAQQEALTETAAQLRTGKSVREVMRYFTETTVPQLETAAARLEKSLPEDEGWKEDALTSKDILPYVGFAEALKALRVDEVLETTIDVPERGLTLPQNSPYQTYLHLRVRQFEKCPVKQSTILAQDLSNLVSEKIKTDRDLIFNDLTSITWFSDLMLSVLVELSPSFSAAVGRAYPRWAYELVDQKQDVRSNMYNHYPQLALETLSDHESAAKVMSCHAEWWNKLGEQLRGHPDSPVLIEKMTTIYTETAAWSDQEVVPGDTRMIPRHRVPGRTGSNPANDLEIEPTTPPSWCKSH